MKSLLRHYFYIAFLGLATCVQAEELKLGTDLTTVPFNYRGDKGQAIGFQIDLIREIGKLEGFTVKVIPCIYPNIFDRLQNHDIDFIGNLYYSKERNDKYLFSEPYSEEPLQFISLEKRGLTSPLQPGVRVATHEFSPSEEQFKAILSQYPDVTIVPEQTSFSDFKAIHINKADVALSYKTNINTLMERYPQEKYKIFPVTQKGIDPTTKVYFATLKENSALIQRINNGLQKVKANGTYEKLKEKYKIQQ